MFVPVSDVYKDCSEALIKNNNITRKYLIQPLVTAGSIEVICKRRNGKVFSVVSHDSEARTRVKGYDAKGQYKRSISYDLSNEKMKILIEASKECRQFTKAECKGVSLLHWGHAWLEGYNSQRLKFWGGGPSNGRGCACGIRKSCSNPSYKCNCDSNDSSVWLKDEGYVEKKSVLPLTAVRIGDTGGSDEDFYYTIGQLECVA